MRNCKSWAFINLLALAAILAWGQNAFIGGKVTLHGQPLASATVNAYLLDRGQTKYTSQWSTTTDRQGEFAVRSLPNGNYIVTIRYGGKVVYQGKAQVPSGQAETMKVDLK